MSNYSKAIAAFLSSVVALGAAFGFNPEWATAENITAASAAVAWITALVWGAPANSEAE